MTSRKEAIRNNIINCNSAIWDVIINKDTSRLLEIDDELNDDYDLDRVLAHPDTADVVGFHLLREAIGCVRMICQMSKRVDRDMVHSFILSTEEWSRLVAMAPDLAPPQPPQ